MNKLREKEGTLVRLVGKTLAYLVTTRGKTSYSFSPEEVLRKKGARAPWFGLSVGSKVIFRINREGKIVSVRLKSASSKSMPAFRSVDSFAVVNAASYQYAHNASAPAPAAATSNISSSQVQLEPTSGTSGPIKPQGAISPTTRKFGKMIDASNLWPGDLMLARPVSPDDFVSKAIIEVQSAGGYAATDARWTHAAMYLGDGQHVVEATFDSVSRGGDVRITHLNEYATGENIFRFRRPKKINNERSGWMLCIKGLSHLKQPYDILYAIRMWIGFKLSGVRFFDNKKKMSATSDAVVCSTFYADSYNEAFRETLGEVNGSCVPAWLSQSDKFDDVTTSWLEIVS